jgi:hypothetical protein
VERRVADGHDTVKTSDIARLMETFQVRRLCFLHSHRLYGDGVVQSSLLHYWEFQPNLKENNEVSSRSQTERVESLAVAHLEHKRIPVIFLDEAHKL